LLTTFDAIYLTKRREEIEEYRCG